MKVDFNTLNIQRGHADRDQLIEFVCTHLRSSKRLEILFDLVESPNYVGVQISKLSRDLQKQLELELRLQPRVYVYLYGVPFVEKEYKVTIIVSEEVLTFHTPPVNFKGGITISL